MLYEVITGSSGGGGGVAALGFATGFWAATGLGGSAGATGETEVSCLAPCDSLFGAWASAAPATGDAGRNNFV